VLDNFILKLSLLFSKLNSTTYLASSCLVRYESSKTVLEAYQPSPTILVHTGTGMEVDRIRYKFASIAGPQNAIEIMQIHMQSKEV
jgi:hypothetical protein